MTRALTEGAQQKSAIKIQRRPRCGCMRRTWRCKHLTVVRGDCVLGDDLDVNEIFDSALFHPAEHVSEQRTIATPDFLEFHTHPRNYLPGI